MVSGQHCPGEVVETPGARLAPVALPMRLGVVTPVPDHRIAAAAGAAHALGPAVLAHQREALGVVQQRREIDQVDGCHDGDGSSQEPVSYSYSRFEARPPSAPRLSPHLTTPEADKSQGSLRRGCAPWLWVTRCWSGSPRPCCRPARHCKWSSASCIGPCWRSCGPT